MYIPCENTNLLVREVTYLRGDLQINIFICSLIGTPFYIMEHVPGRIFQDHLLEGHSPEERTAIYQEMVKTLCKIHSVDINAAGLQDYGKQGQYYLVSGQSPPLHPTKNHPAHFYFGGQNPPPPSEFSNQVKIHTAPRVGVFCLGCFVLHS